MSATSGAGALLIQPGQAWTRFWARGARMAYHDFGPPLGALGDVWRHVAMGLAPGERVLDLGCGAGAALMALQAELAARGGFASLAGVDLARLPPTAPELAQADLRGEVDIAAMPFPDGSFDCVISQFGADAALPAALSEVHRVLRVGGRMILVLHARGGPAWGDAAERLSRLDHLFAPGGVVDAASALAAARVAGDPHHDHSALWEAASHAFTQADAATRGAPGDDAARNLLRDLTVVWRAREQIGDSAMKEAQEELFADAAAYARRLADLVGFSRDAAGMASLSDMVEAQFGARPGVGGVAAAGVVFAWRLEAQRLI